MTDNVPLRCPVHRVPPVFRDGDYVCVSCERDVLKHRIENRRQPALDEWNAKVRKYLAEREAAKAPPT